MGAFENLASSSYGAAALAASAASYKNAVIKQAENDGYPGDLIRRIERRAEALADAKDVPGLRLLSQTMQRFKPQVEALAAFGIRTADTARELSITTKRLAGISATSHQNGITEEAPGISNRARELLQLDDSLPSRLKAADPVFWSRRIKKQWRLLESELNFVLQHREVQTGVRWISPEAGRRYKHEHEFLKKYATGMELIEQSSGEAIPGQKIFDPDEADRRTYANYIARAKGIATLASELGLGLAAMITFTLPSEHHPLTTDPATGKRMPNRHYTGWTIKESHEKFREDWVLIRALLAKHGIDITHFFLAAQPHKSGVPHYHLTGFFRDETHLREVLERCQQTTGQNWMIDLKNGSFQTASGTSKTDPKIRGIRADVFRKKNGDPDPEGALAYMLSSLSYLLPAEGEGQSKRSNEEVRAIKAWSKANGIRRFSTSHGHTTLWTLLRKLEDFGSVAQTAAKSGDYAKFFRTLHLTDKKGEIKKAGAEHFDFLRISKTNDYAEQIEVIRGVNFSRVSGSGKISFAGQYRLEKEWIIQKKLPENPEVTLTNKNQGAAAYAASQPPASPPDRGKFT